MKTFHIKTGISISATRRGQQHRWRAPRSTRAPCRPPVLLPRQLSTFSSLTKVTVAGLALSSYLHQAVTASPGQQSGLRVTVPGKSGSFVTVSGKRYSQVAFTRSVTVLKSQDDWRLPLIVVRKLDLCLDRRLRQQTNVYVSHIFGLLSTRG